MLSAVLDTNILASGALTSSTIPGQILSMWREGQFKLILSSYIINELIQVLNKPYFKRLINVHDIKEFVELLENEAILIQVTVKIEGIATHPEDDFILATALSAKADYLVTGDHALQDLKQFKGIRIVNPRLFSEILQTE